MTINQIRNAFIAAIHIRRGQLKLTVKEMKRLSSFPKHWFDGVQSGRSKPTVRGMMKACKAMSLELEVNFKVKDDDL